MSDGPEQIVRLIDKATGEHQDYEFCPDCRDKDDQIKELERTIRIQGGRITRLERSAEEKDRAHKLWPEAEQVYAWWMLATGHFRSNFSVEDFRHMRPRLNEKDIGPIGLLQAIAGAAHEPSQRPMNSGRVERYDSMELICRERERTLNFQNRVPGDPEGHEWKRWLLARIEENLTSKEDTDG